MNNWVLLQPGEHPPALAPEQFICLAMVDGNILRVMYRFVKNIRGNIAAYLILDSKTSAIYELLLHQLDMAHENEHVVTCHTQRDMSNMT